MSTTPLQRDRQLFFNSPLEIFWYIFIISGFMQRKIRYDIKGVRLLSRKHFYVKGRAMIGCEQKTGRLLQTSIVKQPVSPYEP